MLEYEKATNKDAVHCNLQYVYGERVFKHALKLYINKKHVANFVHADNYNCQQWMSYCDQLTNLGKIMNNKGNTTSYLVDFKRIDNCRSPLGHGGYEFSYFNKKFRVFFTKHTTEEQIFRLQHFAVGSTAPGKRSDHVWDDKLVCPND